MERVVIAFTGPTASGKGTAANFLKETGYAYFSLSDEVRREAVKRGWSTKKEVLQNLGDELRENFGSDVLAVRVVQSDEFKHANKIVIDGIRHPEEILFFKEFFDAKIIGITASEKTRFEYLQSRKREGDPETFEEFLKSEQREQGAEGSHAMQVKKCLTMADIVVVNESGVDRLKENTVYVLRMLGVEGHVVNKERG